MGNQEIKGSLGQGQGYRIIQVSENSPCYNAGINFFTDFIVDIIPVSDTNGKVTDITDLELNDEGQYVVDEKKDFFAIVSDNENKPLKMMIYDILQRKIRQVQIIPNKAWSNQQNLLGVMLRLENYLTSHDNTFKVLTVDENSPAQKAGLQAKYDYVIGLKKYKYDGLDELINIIFDNEGQEIELIVFNTIDKIVKSVMLKPQMNWGGRGLIGCEFAGGYLNQLPVILDEAAELAKLEEEKKRLEQLNMLIHKDDVPQVKQVLSSDPPPTDFSVLPEESSQQSGQRVVAHQHHQINQLRHKKHSHGNEIAHNTNPFEVQRKGSNSQQQIGESETTQPDDQNNTRRKTSALISQENNQSEEPQEIRKNSKSLTNQPYQQNNANTSTYPQYQDNHYNNGVTYQVSTENRGKSLSQQLVNLSSSEQLAQARKDSQLGNRKYEYECSNLQQKYVIMEKDLFNIKVKLQNPTFVF